MSEFLKKPVRRIAVAAALAFGGIGCSNTEKQPADSNAPVATEASARTEGGRPLTDEVALIPPANCERIVFEEGQSPYSKAQEMTGWDPAEELTPAQSQQIASLALQIVRAVEAEGIVDPTKIPADFEVGVCFTTPGDN